MRIVFSENLGHPEISRVLSYAGIHDRLLSYYELRSRPASILKAYISSGLVKRKRPIKANALVKEIALLNPCASAQSIVRAITKNKINVTVRGVGGIHHQFLQDIKDLSECGFIKPGSWAETLLTAEKIDNLKVVIPKIVLKKEQEGIPVRLMLDSGAFSAKQQGIDIDLDDYIRYVKKNTKYIDTYVNLDLIPKREGHKDVAPIFKESAEVSWKNFQYMLKKGLKPIPVFHQGENFSWLEKMVRQGHDYIGVSPTRRVFIDERFKWLDEVFTILTDSDGRPTVKVHGFGLFAFRLLWRYPFETVDSTTWSRMAGFGSVYVPPFRDGKPYFRKRPYRVTVSGRQQSVSDRQDASFERLGKLHQEEVRFYVETHCKVKMKDARRSVIARKQCMAVYFKELSDTINAQEHLFKNRLNRFFQN